MTVVGNEPQRISTGGFERTTGAAPPAGSRRWPRRQTWLALLLAGVVFLIFWAYVPLNMDEYVSYQTLACLTHPFSKENTFNCPCAAFYLRVLGRFRLPLLSYDYIGSLSSLLYAPLYFVWPSPVSARLTGVIALLVQALVLGRMFRFSPAAAFCCLLLFAPYSFVHIADTGPVAFQTTSVFLVCYLLRRWLLCRRRGRRALLAAAAGLVIALGCWVKPTYFFVSFGLAATAFAVGWLALARRHGDRIFRLLEYGLLTAAAALPALLIYQAERPNGGPYLPVLSSQYVPSQIVLTDLGRRFTENVFPFLINPLAAVSPCFDVHPELPALGVAVFALGCGLVLGGAFRRRACRRHRAEVLFNAALFASALLLVATNVYAKSMHHAVLAYPFAILAAARSIRLLPPGFPARAVLPLFLALQTPVFALFPSMLEASRQAGSCKPYAARLNDDLNEHCASDSVIACADWGIYFIKALYGPREQVVLSLRPSDDPTQLPRAAAVARRFHRDLTLVGLRNNPELTAWLRSFHPDVAARTGPGDGSPWRIWRIPYRELEAAADVPAAGPASRAPAVLAGLDPESGAFNPGGTGRD